MIGLCNAPGVTYPELQTELTTVRGEIASSDAASRTELQTGMAAVRSEIASSASSISSELQTEVAALRSEIGEGASSSRLRITFDSDFAGCTFTATSADELEVKTGTVDAGLVNLVSISQGQTTYTVDVTRGGLHYTNTVEIGEYFGEYRVHVAMFGATVNVSTGVTGASVTATLGGTSTIVTGTTGNDGTVALNLIGTGTWTISASIRNYTVDCPSSTATQSLTNADNGGTFSANLAFTSVTVTALSGAVLTLSDGTRTMSVVSTGTNRIYLPRVAATWTVNANYTARGVTAPAQTVALSVTENTTSYTATMAFTTLTLTSPEAATITLTGPSSSTITATSTGTDLFYLPEAGEWTIAITDGTDSESMTASITAYQDNTAEIAFLHIYGVRWAATSDPTWERTDEAQFFTDPVPYVAGMTAEQCSSPFDNLYPWCEMTKEERTGGTMVKIPKFWYKLEAYGSGGLSIKIATRAADGYSVSPAHMDRGDGKGERDVVYVGRYHCATSTYKSTSGVKPQASITRSAARPAIHNLGSTIWMVDFITRFTIWLLYLVEFSNWNSQAKIGYGCGNNSSTENSGASDSMPYHTGTMASARTTYGSGVQYRNIEDLWGNVHDWIDGYYNNSSGINLIKTPANFSDSANGTAIGTPANGYVSALGISNAIGAPIFYSTASGGNYNTYACSDWMFSTSSPCIFGGGSSDPNNDRNLFRLEPYSTSSTAAWLGSRIMELP